VLQCAHIVSRKYSATRTDLDNAFCLCAGCHWHYTLNPAEFRPFVTTMIGEKKYLELYHRAHKGVKSNVAFWQGELDRLREIEGQNND